MSGDDLVLLFTGTAAILQLVAAGAAVRLIGLSGVTAAPVAIAAALVVMASRRLVPFAATSFGVEAEAWAPTNEGLGVLVSGLMLFAVVGLGEVFVARRRAEAECEARSERLAQSEAREQLLSQQVIQAHEQERRLLSYELHDALAQYIVAAQMHLQTFLSATDRNSEKADYELGAVSSRLDSGVREVRRLVSSLGLTVLEDLGLRAAIEQHLQALEESARWEWELQDDLPADRLEPQVETMVFRIVQEALTNAAKHSGTPRVRVHLAAQGGRLSAEVRDWGCGFAAEETSTGSHGVGLPGMQARARMVGGVCAVTSRPGEGTTVRVEVPLAQEQEEELVGAAQEEDPSFGG